MTKRIQISEPNLGDEEIRAIQLPLRTGWLTQGSFVKQFEIDFALKHNVKYAIATTSCTTALHLMLTASGIGPGDEVIVPSFTWVSTANAVIYCGAKPIFVDIDLQTFNISLEDTLRKITRKTKGIIVVDLFGLCVDIHEFRSFIPPEIMIFEDAACASGGSRQGHMAGEVSDAAAFSFHPRKSITTGEGGMLITNNEKVFELAQKLRNHGAEISEEQRHLGPAPYLLPEFNLLGFNYRMTDFQGAIGIEQLKKLDLFIQQRNSQALYYQKYLSDLDWLSLPSSPSDGVHAWQSFVTLVSNNEDSKFRNKVMKTLDVEGIATRPGTHAIHLLGYYSKRFRLKPTDYPNSFLANEQTMAIPLHNKLSSEDQDRVISVIRNIAP